MSATRNDLLEALELALREPGTALDVLEALHGELVRLAFRADDGQLRELATRLNERLRDWEYEETDA